MLVLKRERFDRIVIGERITIRVERLNGRTVRLSITPPGGKHITLKKEGVVVIEGGAITITILRFTGEKVEIGIEAPREVNVRRGEIPKLAS